MIKIYSSDCVDFENNGLGILTDFKTNPEITEILNGNFELNFDYTIKGKNVEYLVVDNIIKTPYDHSEELFRIKRIIPSLTNKKISVYAVHISYDLTENFLLDVAPTNKNAVESIQWLFNHAMFPVNFKVTGDTSETNTARYVRKNIIEAILGADNSIINKWGGDIERNNFNIIYHNKRGNDQGVYIKYGKNIKDIQISIDFSTVVTRIIPQGANELLLPEMYVDSPIINSYRNPIVKKYDFSDISVDENTSKEDAYILLREKAEKLFSDDNIDKPSISVSVNWLELSKTEEYKKYSNFEFVNLGDTVTVDALGYKYKIRVIKVVYDCLQEKYVSFEIGNPRADYVANTSKSINEEIKKTNSSLLEQAKQAATTLINNGIGGNVRVYPDKILIMDTDDEATAKNVWQWNLNGFGYSSEGINGEYETAITIDGQIVANFITTGKLNANVIEGYKELLLKVQNITNQSENIAEIQLELEKINSQIGSITDTTVSASGTGTLSLDNVLSSEILYLHIYPTSRDLSYLYPRDDLYPHDDLFMTSRDLIFESQDNIIKFTLPTNLLYIDDYVKDELFIDYGTKKMYVIHRVTMNEKKEKIPLENPETEYFLYSGISLLEGNYKIYMETFNDAYIQIRTLAKNIYTSQYATRVELNNQILQAKNEMSLTVSQKVYGISDEEGNVTSASVILAINNDESSLQLNADKISLKGKTLALTTDKINIEATNLTIDTEGNIKCNNLEATNGKFSGEVNSSKGTIGGWSIDSSGLSNGNLFIKNNGYSNIYTFADCYIVRNYILGKLELNDDGIKHYDMNSDGKVDISDYAMLIAMVKGER